MIRPLVVLAAIGALVGVVAGCGGSDSPATSSAQGGAPAASSTATPGTTSTPASASSVYQQSDIPTKMNDEASLPACPTYLENESICGHFFNYLLAWQPNATKDATPQLGYRNAAAPDDVNQQALVWLPKARSDGGDAVAGPPTHWDPGGDDGKWHWGPGQCKDGKWRNCDGKKTPAAFSKGYLIEWTDDDANEANGTAWLNMSAGDVDLGQVLVEMYNEGEDGGGRCRTANRSDWPAYVVCGPKPRYGHDAQRRCDHAGDLNDQCSDGFWFRNFPVRITVRDQLPDSRFEITGINADNFKIAAASTLKDPSSIDITTGEATRHLVGFRRFDALDRGDEVVISGVIRSTTSPPDKWSGSTVTMRARLGSDRIGGGTSTTGADRPQGSACNIEKASSETSAREPQCSVVSPVTKGGPGQLNDIQFFLR